MLLALPWSQGSPIYGMVISSLLSTLVLEARACKFTTTDCRFVDLLEDRGELISPLRFPGALSEELEPLDPTNCRCMQSWPEPERTCLSRKCILSFANVVTVSVPIQFCNFVKILPKVLNIKLNWDRQRVCGLRVLWAKEVVSLQIQCHTKERM